MQTAPITVESRPSSDLGNQAEWPGTSATNRSTLAELPVVFNPREARYISKVLTASELAVIADRRDALFIARIKRMPHRKLARYDGFIPSNAADQRFYCAIQRQWLRDEEYLLGTRLGRSPTAKELFIDFMNNHNGLRFRAFFAMKFPDRVKFCKCPTAAPSPANLDPACQPCSKN
jgi:hypothetical protein